MANEGRRSTAAAPRGGGGPSWWLATAIAVLALAGCDALLPASPPAPGSPIPVIAYGAPLETGPKPDRARCDDRVRSAIGGATRIRATLVQLGVSATEQAARAAAADPTADTIAQGIPLTNRELVAIRRGGLAPDALSALSNWVDVGAPEQFGGLWLDGASVFVTVLNGDPATLEFAQCVAPDGTHFLWADTSQAEGRATQDRIEVDMQRLRASGVAINLTYYDVKTGLVMVGVTTPTDAIRTLLRETYGDRIRVIQEGPAEPA